MKTIVIVLVAMIAGFAVHNAASAGPATATGRYVTVWYLEIKYQPNANWVVVGAYSNLASAQQSYTVRARHGGYYQMRIRQALEWRSYLSDSARSSFSPSFRGMFQLR